MYKYLLSDIINQLNENWCIMNNNNNSAKGYLLAFSSYLIWGVLPIYWHNLDSVSSVEILFLRIIFSAITLIIFIHATKNQKHLAYLKDKSTRNKLILSGTFLAINWGFFLYSVSSSHVTQASVGYYINPLISVLLGVIFLKETLNKIQIIAISLAVIGVGYMTISLGEFPYISLILAVSFALYGFIKKSLSLDSYSSLFIETTIFTPIAIIYFIYSFINGTATIAHVNSTELILILLSGFITCLPLILFNEGAKRIPLSSLGILQYIAPTIMLLIGVLMYGESFTKVHAISFIFIWSGCILFFFSTIKTKSKGTAKP